MQPNPSFEHLINDHPLTAPPVDDPGYRRWINIEKRRLKINLGYAEAGYRKELNRLALAEARGDQDATDAQANRVRAQRIICDSLDSQLADLD